MQCRGEWKLARASTMCINHEYQPCVYNTVFRNACISGELPLAPTATRCIFIRDVFYMYVACIPACGYCMWIYVLTIVENYVDL
ncbi:MAG: hypothetical protein K2G49_07270 [Muribaculum sp.]|nr:hypothetical protein [Muribaculum sp.]